MSAMTSKISIYYYAYNFIHTLEHYFVPVLLQVSHQNYILENITVSLLDLSWDQWATVDFP